MSSAARAASTSIERVKSATRASVSPLNRPPQVRIVPPVVLRCSCYPARRTAAHGLAQRLRPGSRRPDLREPARRPRHATARKRPAASSAVRSRWVSASSS